MSISNSNITVASSNALYTKDINTIIEKNHLSLSISTPVKLVCYLDNILLNCFYKGAPKFIESSSCKFCHMHKYQLNKESVLCKKHYAIALYHREDIKLSKITLRGVEYILFGRYVKMEIDTCTYVFYLSPIHVDQSRFRIYVYPKNIFNQDKEVPYTWDLFNTYGIYTFSIQGEPYILDFADQYTCKFKKI